MGPPLLPPSPPPPHILPMDHLRTFQVPSPQLPNFKQNTTCLITSLVILFTSLLLLNVVDPLQSLFALRSRSFSLQILSPRNNSSSPSSSSSKSATAVPCDYSYGRWVRDDDATRRSYAEDCRFLDPGFRCHENGRRDLDYRRWRWQPEGCDLPRFNASKVLEMSRNMRIVFAGDSIGRNQWESLLCMLASGVGNKSTIYEENGKPITKHKGYLSIKFHDYNLTVEYYRLPFLVVIGRPPQNSSKVIKKAIRVDQLHWMSRRWIGADIFIFNLGHWWNQEKTEKMGVYFQEGKQVNMTMGVREAFRRTLETWKQWVFQNLDPKKSRVFFRSYAPTHFRGGRWNEGGRCDLFTGPETNYTELKAEPWNNQDIFEKIEELKGNSHIHVRFLNITYLTEFRRDGHPSIHREPGMRDAAPQDCSHWCLPGIPDTWNELLYAHLPPNPHGGNEAS